MIAMEDSGFILSSYAITVVVVAAFVWRTIVAGRRLGRRVPDDDKYWT